MPDTTGYSKYTSAVTALALKMAIRDTGAGFAPVTAVPVSRLDVFGRERVSQLSMVFTDNQGYDGSPLLWQVKTSGAGATGTWDSTTRSTPLTLTAATGYVVRQTYQYHLYQPFRSQTVVMTGVIGAAAANATKQWGQFDAKNGVFFRQDPDGTLNCVERYNGVDIATPRSSWSDKLDGTGLSGLTLDVTKAQICIFEYGWLGQAPVRYGFMIDGVIVYVYIAQHSNRLTTSYIQTANLPLRWEISSTGSATATLTAICCAVASEGGSYDSQGAYPFTALRELSAGISAAGSDVPIVGIRPALTYNSLVNRFNIRLKGVDVTASAAPARWTIYYYPPGSTNPITAGGSWAVINANSGTEVNAGGTALSLTGAIPILSGFVGTSSGASNRGSVSASVLALAYPLTLDMSGANDPRTNNTGANPAYLILAAGQSTGSTVAGAVDYEEIR